MEDEFYSLDLNEEEPAIYLLCMHTHIVHSTVF
jgi:hypothetical protein